MSEFKTLTFKEISDALNAGKQVEVEGCKRNPFKLVGGFLVDRDGTPYIVGYDIHHAMIGLEKARIIEPKLTRWIVVYRFRGGVCTTPYDSEKDAERTEKYCKEKGWWMRTVKVEV